MPRIKRWFPVSHDINSDPEVIQLTDRFGLTGLKVWLEILSIADRNEGVVPGDEETTLRALSIKCNSTLRQLRGIYELIQSLSWINSEFPIRVLNYAKYHRTEERKKNGFRSLPDLTRPDRTPLTPLSGNGTRSHAQEKGKAAAAWDEVLSLVHSGGRYAKPAYSSPDIENAVLDIGGFSTICDSRNLDSTKRQFFSAYNKITSETKP